MKRGGPLQRRTPLTGKNSLARAARLVSEKCPLCGHALTRHNSLGYCRTGECPCDSTAKVRRDRTPIAPRSAKREAVMVHRRKLVADILTARPHCEARLHCCTGRSVDVHERLSRARGGDILDESILAALCRACHDWITTHPKEAEELGWALPSWWKGEESA